MTTLTTYTELKTNILDHAKRDDLNSKLDLFIDLAEADIEDVLRVREMESTTTLTTSTSDRFVTLPTDFIKVRRLQIIVDSVYSDMNYIAPKSLTILEKAGTPFLYTINDKFELNRTSDVAYSLELQYYKTLTALSSSQTTSDILTNHPMVYLSACLRHFGEWAQDAEFSSYWASVFDRQVSRANRRARRGRIGSAPSISIPGMIV